MPLQLYDMNSSAIKFTFKVGVLGECHFQDKVVLGVNVVMVLIIIPLLNSIVYPFLREYMPNMVKRIGLGAIFAVLAQLSMLILSGVGSRRDFGAGRHDQCAFFTNFTNITATKEYVYSSVPEYYALIPLFLITLAEILVNITSKNKIL